MTTRRWTARVVVACLLALAGGCATVPPAPDHPAMRPEGVRSSGNEDEYEGWLFDRLTGRRKPAAQPAAGQGVQQTSAVQAGPESPGAVQPAVAPSPVMGTSLSDVGTSLDGVSAKKNEDEDSGFSLSDLEPENIGKNFKKMIGLGPNEAIAQAAYKEGEALYSQKKFKEAAEKFKTAADRWPDSTLEEDALFLLGESYFFSDQYSKAHDAFGKLMKKYDNSRHLDTVASREFVIGRYWEQIQDFEPHWPLTPNFSNRTRPMFDTFGNSIKAYEFVRLYDPTGPLADDSLMAAGNAYFRKNRFEDAAYQYDRLCKDYPKSPFQKDAHLLDMKAKREIYQGPLYDGKPLEEAGQIAEQTLTQFRGQLGEEQSQVLQAKNEIDLQRCARDWAMAQYYDNRGYYGAARYYYQVLINEHPQSEPGRAAQARLEQIKDEPDRPPNHFKWLTDAFSLLK